MTIPVGRKTTWGEYCVGICVLSISMLRDHVWRQDFAISITTNTRQLKAAIPNKWGCTKPLHVTIQHVTIQFSKENTDQYQVTEMHKEESDLLCDHGGIKISFFQDLSISAVSWLLTRNRRKMWTYVAKAQENIMEKGILIYTVKPACLIVTNIHLKNHILKQWLIC